MTLLTEKAISDCQDALTNAGINLKLATQEGPVFCEPWQAQAFAMTLALHERGVFTWDLWANTLGSVIKEAQANGDPDRGDTYYQHWLTALERIVSQSGAVTAQQIHARQHAWEQAAARTPHGEPIELTDAERAL